MKPHDARLALQRYAQPSHQRTGGSHWFGLEIQNVPFFLGFTSFLPRFPLVGDLVCFEKFDGDLL